MNLQDDLARAGWQPRQTVTLARNEGLHRSGLDSADTFGDLLGRIRGSWLGLVIWLAICCTAATVYLAGAAPEYEATTQVVLEQRQPVVTGSGVDQTIANLGPTLDSAQADSQVNVIKSERVLRFVFETLQLATDPAYVAKPPGLISTLLARIPFFATEQLTPEQRAAVADAQAFQNFAKQIAVKRVGQSYVIEIAFRAPSPEQAAKLANSITASYIREQVRFRAATVQREVEFLQNRMSAIQTEIATAVEAVKTGVIPTFQFADSDARVVGAAQVPLSKAYPLVSLILALVAAFAIVTGFGFIFIRYKLDRTIHSRQQIGRDLNIDLVNVLPRYVDRSQSRPARGGTPCIHVVENGGARFIEGLRILRTTVLSSNNASRHIAVGVVSWSPGEGRSSIASNLARLMAASRERVVLIDADFRNPALTGVLAPDSQFGLDEALLSHSTSTTPLAVEISPSLSFIPAVGGGQPSNPNVFLGAAEMQTFVAQLHKDRDIIIDLPPISLSSDAQAIGHLLDGVILVVEADRTSIDDATDACRALEAAHTRVLTVVLNKAQVSRNERNR